MSSLRAPFHAASVILCRRPDDLEIFWVRRQDALPFLGGFHSFPGGRLSREDDPAGLGLEGGQDDGPLRVCALRELYEETGVLIGSAQVPVPDFATGVRVGALRPELAALVPAGRWITPPFSPVRFDTAFYLAWMPDGVEPRVHPGELAEGEWIRPGEALDRWGQGLALLAPPTLYTLRGLEAAALMASGEDQPLSLEAAADYLTGADEASGGPVTRIEMRPGFFLFPMQTQTLPPATHTNAFLVGGSEMVLIDPAAADPAERERLLGFIERLGGEGRGVAEIWLTHQHPDHVGGVAEVAGALKVPVRAHPETVARLSGLGVPVEPTLVDGHVRSIAGRPGWRLRVVHTPGHAVGHVAIFEEVAGTLIAGDMLAGAGFIVIDPPEGDMALYMESLRRLRDLPASALFASHGPPTAGARARIEEYLAHRLEREARVVASLSDGAPHGLDDLLPQVYADVDASLHPLARRSLLAHLIKLEREGAVRAAGDRWRKP